METGSDVMKLIRIGQLNLGAVLLSSLLLILFVSFADAQKSSRKKKTRKTTAVTTTPVPPATSEPIIVSRASDYQSQDLLVTPSESDGQGVSIAETERERQLADLSARIKRLESEMKNGYDEKQKRLLLNLDILTKAEQRAESLRKQRFDLIEKENQIQSRLDQIEIDIRPETIERAVAIAGSLRPEELRDRRRRSLDAERRNLQSLLTQVQSTRAALEQSVEKADQLVQKLRSKLETDIDKSLDDDKDQ